MELFSYQVNQLPKIRFLGKVFYKEPWKHFARTINEYIVYIIKQGNLYIKEGNKSYNLKPGDFFILEPNVPHVGYQAASCEYYYFHFKEISLQKTTKNPVNYLEELKDKRRKALLSDYLSGDVISDGVTYLPKHFSIQSTMTFDRLKYLKDLFYNKEEFYKETAATLMHTFLLNVSHKMLVEYITKERTTKVKKSELICEQIVEYINENYMKPMNSTDIEDLFEVNFDHINREFNHLMGTTIIKYLNQVKINNAKHMIEASNLNFGDISYLVGIEDRFYFTRVFKRYTGMTPTEYYRFIHIKNK